MKEDFIGYYRPSDDEFKALWETAVFVPDTSFLLTLYRLPADPRTKMFDALDAIADRLWVPHNVILEYMRNRPAVIADQKTKFNEVRKLISDSQKKLISDLSKLKLKKRHSLINTEQFENNLRELVTGFDDEISELENQHITYENDDLFTKIFELFTDKIGPAPENQDEIDIINKDAETRYSKKIPPGYMDIDKSKDKASYEYGGIIYQRQYGDYLTWKQLIKHATDNEVKSIIFITDDTKEDWFWTINKQKIGPRPELVEEIKRLAGTELFYIYSTENFIKYANSYLTLNINDAALRVIKDISEISREEDDPLYIAAKNPEDIVEMIIQDLGADLVHSDDTITSAIAETNACSWGLDDYVITFAEYDKDDEVIYFKAEISLAGDSDEDRPWCGDKLEVELSGTLFYTGDSFLLERYDVDSCESNF